MQLIRQDLGNGSLFCRGIKLVVPPEMAYSMRMMMPRRMYREVCIIRLPPWNERAVEQGGGAPLVMLLLLTTTWCFSFLYVMREVVVCGCGRLATYGLNQYKIWRLSLGISLFSLLHVGQRAYSYEDHDEEHRRTFTGYTLVAGQYWWWWWNLCQQRCPLLSSEEGKIITSIIVVDENLLQKPSSHHHHQHFYYQHRRSILQQQQQQSRMVGMVNHLHLSRHFFQLHTRLKIWVDEIYRTVKRFVYKNKRS